MMRKLDCRGRGNDETKLDASSDSTCGERDGTRRSTGRAAGIVGGGPTQIQRFRYSEHREDSTR